MTPPKDSAKLAPIAIGMLASITFFNILPQTLIVPVLRDLTVDRFGVSERAAHLFMVVNMIGAVLAAPLAGMAADRFGRRRSQMIAALAIDSALLAALSVVPSYELALGVRFFEGAANIWALSMVLAIAGDEMRRRNRPRLMGVVGASLTFGVAMGVPIGGVLGSHHPLLPLYAGAGIALLTAALAATGLRREVRPGPRPDRPAGSLLRRAPRLGVPFCFAFVDRFTVGFFVSTLPLYLKGPAHNLPPDQVGLHLALFLVPFAVLSWPMGRLSERLPPTRLIAAGSLIYGALVCCVGFVPIGGLPWLMIALGVASSVMFVPTLILTARIAPPGGRDTAMGGFNAAGSLGFLVGPLVARESYAAWGIEGAFLLAGLSEILCVFFLVLALERIRATMAAGPGAPSPSTTSGSPTAGGDPATA